MAGAPSEPGVGAAVDEHRVGVVHRAADAREGGGVRAVYALDVIVDVVGDVEAVGGVAVVCHVAGRAVLIENEVKVHADR